MENRNGLVVGGGVTLATGTAEREAALAMVDGTRRSERRITLGADKAHDVKEFIGDLRGRSVTPHIAVNDTRRRPASDARRPSSAEPCVTLVTR